MLIGLLLVSIKAFSKDVQVDIVSFSFQPEEIQAEVGDVLIFVNKDRIHHSVVPALDSHVQFEGSDVLRTGQMFELKVEEVKDIKVKCGLHPHMPGMKIKVTTPQ